MNLLIRGAGDENGNLGGQAQASSGNVKRRKEERQWWLYVCRNEKLSD